LARRPERGPEWAGAEGGARRASGVHLVTGAGGFIGRALVESLAAGGEPVRAMFRTPPQALPSGAESITADLSDPLALRRAVAGCDSVFHLAGKAHDLDAATRSDAFRAANVDGTRSILEAALEAGTASFVFASSVKAMGEGGEECLDEEAPASPRSPYGRSKLEAEGLVLEAGARSRMRATVLRLPLVYGPRMKGNLLSMLDAIESGFFPPLPGVANRRSLASVGDVVQAFRLSAAAPAAAGRTYLVTDGVDYSSRGIYDAMREALGKRPVRWSVPLTALRAAAAFGDAAAGATGRRVPFGRAALEKLLGSACYRNERIRRELGFRPVTTLQAALPEIVRIRRSGP
ncbi:MAG TPA: NAD-dependent epimerase/dehydratase family protein, partial [Thermoanaerobaculia bacterium]|nr:NAD-dependent epimerase/dehydratase family protein [Thermoanaerobaculia bacterium]